MICNSESLKDACITAKAFLFYRRTGYMLARNVFVGDVKRAMRKTKTSSKKINASTLADLLDALNECHDQLTMPTIKNIDWLDDDKRRAFRKIGTYVVRDKLIRWEPRVPASIERPTIAVIHWMLESEMAAANEELAKKGEERSFYNSMLFAMKIKSLPAYVSKAEGDHFEFGVGLLCNRKKEDGDKLNRLVWRGGYVTITSAGDIVLHDELRTNTATIEVRDPYARKAIGPKRHINRLEWMPSSLIWDETIKQSGSVEKARKSLASCFAFLLRSWNERNKSWLVSTERTEDRSRVTFVINSNSAPTFFKDRNKTAKARDGKTKRIIHICEAHMRNVDGKEVPVKSHIRGIREFDWKNFKCKITAPTFHLHNLLSGSLDIAAEDLESIKTPGEYMTAEGLAERIAAHDYELEQS